jgi:chorismate mutase
MRRLTGPLAIAIMVATSDTSMARPQSAADRLQPLADISARRLAIAEQVALAKWDSASAVEDTVRETAVIARAVADGESKGLDRRAVANFFRAQIEANKLVQYSLLAEWHRNGSAPAHQSIDLTGTIRPQLDHLQTELVQALANTSGARASETCPADIANAVKTYLASHQYDIGPLRVIALDRALAATCTA